MAREERTGDHPTYGSARVAKKAMAIAAEKARALLLGNPYGTNEVPGHVPDTAIAGEPEPPCGFLRMDSRANSIAGGGLSSRVDETITHLTLHGVIP
jgi:hypothetical protein